MQVIKNLCFIVIMAMIFIVLSHTLVLFYDGEWWPKTIPTKVVEDYIFFACGALWLLITSILASMGPNVYPYNRLKLELYIQVSKELRQIRRDLKEQFDEEISAQLALRSPLDLAARSKGEDISVVELISSLSVEQHLKIISYIDNQKFRAARKALMGCLRITRNESFAITEFLKRNAYNSKQVKS